MMYMMAPTKKWTIATARQEFSSMIGFAAREPQRVYRRNKLVAAVISPGLADELAASRRPRLGDALVQLQRLCAKDDYELAIPDRRDRPNPVTRRKR